MGKVFARVLLGRLQKLAERVYPESQCGFRAGRSTVDMAFSLRQIQKKCREQQMPLYIAFIDLTRAFDLVSREGLFKILIGCPPKLQSLIESFHSNINNINNKTTYIALIQSCSKRGQARLRSRSHSLRDVLRSTSEARIRHITEEKGVSCVLPDCLWLIE